MAVVGGQRPLAPTLSRTTAPLYRFGEDNSDLGRIVQNDQHICNVLCKYAGFLTVGLALPASPPHPERRLLGPGSLADLHRSVDQTSTKVGHARLPPPSGRNPQHWGPPHRSAAGAPAQTQLPAHGTRRERNPPAMPFTTAKVRRSRSVGSEKTRSMH